MKCYGTLIFLVLAIVMSVLGCTGEKQTVTPNQIPTIAPTFTPIQHTTTASATPSPTITPTMTVTSTPTRTPTPISTLFATIAPLERDEYVHRLNTLNEICTLPCWGMIQPGKTRYEDIEAYLQSLTSDYERQFFSINDVIGKDQMYVNFQIDRHYVVQIILSESSYDLSELLVQNGIPEEIWIRQLYGTPDSTPFFYYKLVLFYPSRGILAYFSGESEVPSVEQAEICPLKVYENPPLPPEKNLSLWTPNSIREFSETGYAENWFPNSSSYYYQISEVSDLDEEEFYQIFSDRTNQDECFAIDIFKYMEFVDIVTPTP